MSTLSTDDPLVARTRAVWTSGDFEHIARAYVADATAFIERLGLEAGEQVLDVACGTGNLTVPAARTGAAATGLDIAPHLLAHACEHASEQGVTIRLDEGNAEDMPYPDGAFDTVVTMFGAMFAPRPELAAAEMRRVVRPGGRIAMANWMKDGFIGQMLRMHVTRVPPPAGVPSVLLWGDEATVRERFADARSVACTRRPITFRFPTSPTGVVEIFRTYYGPTVRTFAALEPEAREEFARELERHWTAANAATDGTTRVETDYLEVLVVT